MLSNQILLFALLVIACSRAGAFAPSSPAKNNFATIMRAEEEGATATSNGVESYVRCGRCQTSYSLTEEQLGKGRGRRLECSVCGHSWFQSRDRVMNINNGFELVPLPESDLERIKMNIEEGKSPKFMGDVKLYVGNMPFSTTEDDIMQMFSDIGTVGDVSLVRDELGRNRGFGFVTMRTKADGDKAIDVLDGFEIDGRNIAVRQSNN